MKKPKPEYISYPIAMRLLREQLEATPEELAAWLFYSPHSGRLTAYLNADELGQQNKFSYATYNMPGEYDPVAPLMHCWFIAAEIANFHPTERYCTGKALIERWSKQPDISPKAHIQAKIWGSKLEDFRPVYMGLSDAVYGFGTTPPPIETGLFALSQIEKIEADEFGSEKVKKTRKQDDVILNWLRENKYNPLKLPVGTIGKAGIRKACGDEVCKNMKLFSSRSVFDTAWDRLRDNGETKAEK